MKGFLISGLVAAAFLGIADSWYLAATALAGAIPACDVAILSGCEAVASSPYSKLFGIPLGVYGTVFYSLVFTLSALLVIAHKRRAYLALYVLSIVGFLASLCFILIQALVIRHLCVYCVISAVLATAVFALARSLYVRFAPLRLAVVG